MKTRRIVVVACALAAGVSACELIATFDRSLIPADSDGSSSDADASDTDSAPDSGARTDSGGGDAIPPGYLCPPLGASDGGSFVPSNFDPTMLDASTISAIDLTDTGGSVFDTDALTLTCPRQSFFYSATRVGEDAGTRDGGAEIAVFTMGSFTIEPGVVVDAVGKRPLVIYAQGPVEIAGVLRASAVTAKPPYGNPAGSFQSASNGYCGASALGPQTYGNAALIPLLGGTGTSTGGGAIQVTSRVSIAVRAGGLIDVNGMGGNAYFECGLFCHTDPGASGGAIALEAPIVTIDGDLAANGGSGASPSSGADCISCRSGKGSLGTAQADTCGPGGGGEGSYGDDPTGHDGGGCLPGGGAGWITIKTGQCGSTGSFVGVVSPSFKSGCANVLPLMPP